MSLSKGCFLFKPKRKITRPILPQVTFTPFPGETEKDAASRGKIFDQYWSSVEQKIKDISLGHMEKLLDSFNIFVADSKQYLESFSYDTMKQQESVPLSNYRIPTAVIYEGISCSTDDNMISYLQDNISSSITPTIVRLTSSSSVTGMKFIMKEIMQQLIECDDESVSQKIPDSSIITISSWYDEYIEDKTDRPPIFIMIDDFESFPLNILQDMITLFSSRLHQLPVILVFGLQKSISLTNLHHLLPMSVVSMLDIQEFKSDFTESIVNQILQEISFDPNFIVKFSPSCCQLLLDNFRYTHSSVSTCERMLQFMMLEHFYWQPLSFLCRKWSVVQDSVQNINHNHCDMIRATPSFMRHVEKQSPKVKLDLLLDDEVLKKEALRLMKIISEYHRDLEILILCLSYFNVDTEGNSVLKKLQLLDVVFKASGTQSVRVILDSMLQCFKFMSHLQFRDTIQKCTSYLTGLQNAKRKHYPKWCSKLLQELMKVLNELDEALKSLPVNTEMEKIKRDLINYLLDFFQSHLLTRDCLILHEIFYYEDTKMLSKQISVSPQLTITKALGSPQFYLKAPVEDSPVTMPYTSVAYQHYLSFGKVIDLYEWMQICCESEKDSERLPLSHRQAGFMQAISEMKLIGFHKPLSQRSNSVAKLYWGSK